MAETVRKSLSEIFRRHDFDNPSISTMSVNTVVISSDLRYADVYVFPLTFQSDQNDNAQQKKELLESLTSCSRKVNHILGSRLRSKFTPRLRFHIDQNVEIAEKIENLFTLARNRENPQNQ